MSAPPPAADLRTLRRDLSGADDDKIRRIVSLVEANADPGLNQALLDPLRARLAPLRPPRALRLPRLLFMPFDPVIVPPKQWRADEPAVPRPALAPLGRLILGGLGDDRARAEALIAGQADTGVEAVAAAGAILWPQAAAIAVAAQPPPDWNESGLPQSVFAPLMRAMAVVWRRAPRLRVLFRDGQIGALKADEIAVNTILAGAPGESPLGCAMVARLILLQSPFAAQHVRLFANASANRGDQAVLQKAIVQGVAETVAALEQPDAFATTVTRAALEHAGETVRTLMTLLRQIEDDVGGHIAGPRLKTIRDSLGRACRSRFADGMTHAVIAPLVAATEPLDSAAQTQLEAAARDLRVLDTAARPLGGASDYDALLAKAAGAVESARHRGTLSRIAEIRLTEIIAGPEAALNLYRG